MWVMAYVAVDYVVVAYAVSTNVVMAYIVMTYIVMANVAMAVSRCLCCSLKQKKLIRAVKAWSPLKNAYKCPVHICRRSS